MPIFTVMEAKEMLERLRAKECHVYIYISMSHIYLLCRYFLSKRKTNFSKQKDTAGELVYGEKVVNAQRIRRISSTPFAWLRAHRQVWREHFLFKTDNIEWNKNYIQTYNTTCGCVIGIEAVKKTTKVLFFFNKKLPNRIKMRSFLFNRINIQRALNMKERKSIYIQLAEKG